jgi:hypothetical protein
VHRLRTDSADLMSDASSSSSASSSSWYSSWEAAPREAGECAYASSGGGASHDDGAAVPPPRCAALRGLLGFVVGVLLAGDEGAALVGLAPTAPPLAVDIGEEAAESSDMGSPDRELRLLLVGDGILLTPTEPDDDAVVDDDDPADDLDASRSLKSVMAYVTDAASGVGGGNDFLSSPPPRTPLVATLLPTSSAGLALSPTAGGGTRPFFSDSLAGATTSPSPSTAALSADATVKVHLAAAVGDVAGRRAAAEGACVDFFLFFFFFFLLFPFDGVPALGAAATSAAGDAACAGPPPCASVSLAPGAASCCCRPSLAVVAVPPLRALLSERSGPPAAVS